jgi:hypothetical protein
MRGRKKNAAGRGGWRRREIELAKAGELMRAAGFLMSPADPVSAHAHYDYQGRVRRAHATYEDGWRATLQLRLDGTSSLSMAIRLIVAPSELREPSA